MSYIVNKNIVLFSFFVFDARWYYERLGLSNFIQNDHFSLVCDIVHFSNTFNNILAY